MKKNRYIIIECCLLILYIYVSNITLIPQKIVLLGDENFKIRKFWGINTIETVRTSTDSEKLIDVDITLFGNKIKSFCIESIENVEVIPIGKIIGMKLYTQGVLVVGLSEVEDINNEMVCPFLNCDIKEGDTILELANEKIDNIETLKKVVNQSTGKSISVKIRRNNTVFTSNITPAQTEQEEYKLGLWVKDAATGVGTITYYEKSSGSFAALGHGIIDYDTNKLIEIKSGEIVTADVLAIQKGKINSPGEIKGKITNQKILGEVIKNTEFGLYGKLNNLASLNINTEESMKVASRDEISIGDAELICSLDGEKSKKYKIKIEKIYKNNNYDNKSMMIRITDKNLIDETGGIIRGLSGSPIVQNGKFIGCVTNVLVSNPEIGYAVFGDMMIKEMRK